MTNGRCRRPLGVFLDFCDAADFFRDLVTEVS
jgi:hypothetical protein